MTLILSFDGVIQVRSLYDFFFIDSMVTKYHFGGTEVAFCAVSFFNKESYCKAKIIYIMCMYTYII